MPIFEYKCEKCGKVSELLIFSGNSEPECPECGSRSMTKLMSATSSLTGQTPKSMPGPSDTACCGSRPGQAPGCAGPGSCCGKI